MPRKQKDDRERSAGDRGKGPGTGHHHGRDLGMHAQKTPEEGSHERTPDTRYWHEETQGHRRGHR
ncbi:hypothetical protein CTZ27_18275 [Streptomyces griseocarneus]|nr:hypothetical protein CTZ27_18275 [Streptomyces griseocarneus]